MTTRHSPVLKPLDRDNPETECERLKQDFINRFGGNFKNPNQVMKTMIPLVIQTDGNLTEDEIADACDQVAFLLDCQRNDSFREVVNKLANVAID